jgi:hypothetical protein
MIKFVQATKEDVLSIYPQLLQSDTKIISHSRDAFARNLIPLEGRAIAIHDGGQCVGAYGIIEMWPGVARIWALFSDDLLMKHPTLLSLHAKRDLKKADQFGFHRIEATAGTDHEDAAIFLTWLGFDLECRMRRYTANGEDTYLYARVKNV